MLINRSILTVLLATPCTCLLADWREMEVIITGGWGDGINQFQYEDGDSESMPPGNISVSDEGYYAMSDWFNLRIKIYNPEGEIHSLIDQFGNSRQGAWPTYPKFLGDKLVVLSNDILSFFNLDGTLYKKIELPEKALSHHIKVVDNVVYVYFYKKLKSWHIITLDGDIRNVGGSAPQALNSPFYNRGNKYHLVSFKKKDILKSIVNKNWVDNVKILEGNIFGIYSKKNVTIVDTCGGLLSEFRLPENIYRVKPSMLEGVEDYAFIEEEYRNLTLDINGNIYATKQTADSYSLVSWSYDKNQTDSVNTPEPPFGVDLSLGDSFVDISWNLSLHDSSCVHEYQLFRADSIDSIEKEIGAVTAGVEIYRDTTVEPGKEYTYRLKASSALGDSEFSESITVTVPE